MEPLPFATVAHRRAPQLDELALALAAELRPIEADAALDELDRLGEEVARAAAGARTPEQQAAACREVLGARERFEGDRDDYDHPDNSMLDRVLERRRGLPILLSVVYAEVARRAGIALAGVGLPGHYVVGHFGVDPPLLIDPFNGGAPVTGPVPSPANTVRPWGAHETALRMLNNLVPAYTRRFDLARAIRAAELRLELPLDDAARAELDRELGGLRARLN